MYRLITAFLEPYTFLLLSVLAILLYTRWRETGRRLFLSSALTLVILLCFLSLPLTGNLAERSLERAYSPCQESPSTADTVVVLAGDAHLDNREGTAIRLGSETLFRCLHASELYHRGNGCHVIVSGGKITASAPPVAEAMRDFLVTVGVPRDRISLEDESTTTFENATYTCQILRRAPPSSAQVFLVTSATHMRRAAHCFERQGLHVTPSACNYHALRLDFLLMDFIPSASGIRRFQTAMHEWVGLLWYWLLGRV